ncbi:MAG: UvrD-helicase domain-containing protein [Rikenellaceae bacterium]
MADEIIAKVRDCIQSQKNFLLSGGAGSGKTYTLMQVLDIIRETSLMANIACITYTNVAADEIKSRSPYKNIRVSTIHDFLWGIIEGYQHNLKQALVHLVEIYKIDPNNGIKYTGDDEITLEYYNSTKIVYKDYRKLEKGVVWHDDVVKLADYMFAKYPLLGKILKDRYPYILVDEYQDTDKRVIKILLDYIQKTDCKGNNTIGFFGDSMQSIYDKSGVGNIDNYVANKSVVSITKEDNYRCSTSVINLLNLLRSDIHQKPAGNNLEGAIKLIYSSTGKSIKDIKKLDIFKCWSFSDTENTKELYLTHRLVGAELGISPILDIYRKQKGNADYLLGDKDHRDVLINHVIEIQNIIYLYDTKRYNELINKIDFKLTRLSDKSKLKESIERLKSNAKTLCDLIRIADEEDLLKIDNRLSNYKIAEPQLYSDVITLDITQIQHVYNYTEGYSPYSTQHGVKGAEFENVLVVLDNGNWNQYNFIKLLESNMSNQQLYDRTLKLFYVCCSRAKDNLVVYIDKPTRLAVEGAIKLFGEDNVIKI